MMLFVFISFLALPQLGLAEEYTTGEEVKKEEKEKTKEEAKKEKKAKKKKAVKMEEMVVTATRTEKEILDVPTNISVITKEDIEKMKPIKITDVLKHIPGIFITESGSYRQVNIRGTRQGSTGGAYVMIDGIPIQMGKYSYTEWWMGIQPEDVEKIEVVKGPLSSLYGGDAARGVINIVRKKGEEKPSYKISGMFGDYGERRYGVSGRGAIKKLDYSLSAGRREYDGYRRGADYDGSMLFGNVGYFIDDYTRVGLIFALNDFEKKSAPGLTKAQVDEDRRQSPYLSDHDNTDIGSGLSYNRDTQNYLIKVSAYYKDRDRDYHYNRPNTGRGDPDKYKYKSHRDEGVFGLKSQFGLKGNLLGRKNNLTLGFDVDSDKLKNKREYQVKSASNIKKEKKSSGEFKKDLYGFFIQDELNLFKPLTLTMGLRYDLIKYDMDYKNDKLDDKPDFDKLNPRIGLSYRFSDKNSAYLTYSKAYRAGTLGNYTSTATYSEKYDYEIKPEDYTDYEVGYRNNLGKWLFLDLNLFYTRIKDEIMYYYVDGRYAGSKNYGETTHQGVELSFKGALWNKLDYQLAYSYLDTEVKEGKYKGVNLKGKELVRAPHHTFTAILDYKLLELDGTKVNWHFGILAISDYYRDMENKLDKYSGYGVANTRLSLIYKGLECYFGIDNVFDKEYDGWVGKKYYPAPDRTYMGGISFAF
ncbi:MAG: TonB-dependent receptor [Deltaproteobacteria bacterium]|nr:TonB-dependent receptor [Deltaproteobacteria bacterium]